MTIPKKSLKELGLKVGDKVVVEVDRKDKVVRITSATKLSKADERIARLTMRFIERYRADLEELANK